MGNRTTQEIIEIALAMRGMTLSDLADRLGVGRTWLTRRFGGQPWRRADILAVAAALDVPPDIVETGEGALSELEPEGERCGDDA